jgi:hypothetical protein
MKKDDMKNKKVTETKPKETIRKIELRGLNIKTLRVNIVGKSPLLMDKIPKEVLDSILAKQTGISNTNAKKIRDPKEEIKNAIHYTSDGKIGYPVQGFKRGMMDCAVRLGNKFFTKSLVAGSIRITNAEDGLILIKSDKPTVFERNISHNTKYSPMFKNWSAELIIKFDANNISEQDIITLINYAGFYVGIGSWRPKCRDGGSGEYGCYEIENHKN